MADAALHSPNYRKFAFQDQHNLVLLFGAACFSLAFASRLPGLVGACAEFVWLLLAPGLPAFRSAVDRRLTGEYLARAEAAIEGALAELTERDVTRFRALSRALVEPPSSVNERERRASLHALLELRRTFLDYLFLGQRIQTLFEPTPAADLEHEVAQLQAAYGAERELTARMTIRQTLSSLQRRLNQRADLTNVSHDVELRLDMLEKIPSDFASRQICPGAPLFAEQLDAALAEVGAADALESAVDAILVRTELGVAA